MNTKDLVEKLSEKVHDAWAREKDAQGFHSPSYHEDGSICSKCHSDMIPYEWLEENIKEYDRVTVRTVLQALDELGVRLDRSTQKTGLSFGQAWKALEKGLSIARVGWNGKNMHINILNLYTADNVPIDNKCLVLYNVHGKYNTWVPSITDLLADDWEVVE